MRLGTDDIDNQGAAFLAREEDEKGTRTIGKILIVGTGLVDCPLTSHPGVLTKPDTIQHGEEDGWLKVLEGASHNLKRRYLLEACYIGFLLTT